MGCARELEREGLRERELKRERERINHQLNGKARELPLRSLLGLPSVSCRSPIGYRSFSLFSLSSFICSLFPEHIYFVGPSEPEILRFVKVEIFLGH